MTQNVKILAMHPGMQGLFPNKPEHWDFITHCESAEATIAERGNEVEMLLSASIEKLDKAVLEQLPNLKMVALPTTKTFKAVFEEWRDYEANGGTTQKGGTWDSTIERIESYA